MSKLDKPEDIDYRIALQARDWLVRLTSGNVSEVQLQRFKTWRASSSEHQRAFDRERTLWQQLQMLEIQKDDFSSAHSNNQIKSPCISRRRLLIGGAAATATAAIAAIMAPSVQTMLEADFSTSVGEMATIELADGSIASLNTDSAIAVNFTPGLRLVQVLKGEAQFKVRRDPNNLFRVAALGGNSDVYGTTFAVKVVDDVTSVTVIEGSVRVSGQVSSGELLTQNVHSVDLGRSEQTHYRAGGLPSTPKKVDTDQEIAWINGRIIFEGKPFLNAIAELGRYVHERIVIRPGVNTKEPVSGVFSTKHAFSAIEALAKTQGLSTRRLPGLMIALF